MSALKSNISLPIVAIPMFPQFYNVAFEYFIPGPDDSSIWEGGRLASDVLGAAFRGRGLILPSASSRACQGIAK